MDERDQTGQDDDVSGLPEGFTDEPMMAPPENLEDPPESGRDAQPGIPEPGVEPPSDG